KKNKKIKKSGVPHFWPMLPEVGLQTAAPEALCERSDAHVGRPETEALACPEEKRGALSMGHVPSGVSRSSPHKFYYQRTASTPVRECYIPFIRRRGAPAGVGACSS